MSMTLSEITSTLEEAHDDISQAIVDAGWPPSRGGVIDTMWGNSTSEIEYKRTSKNPQTYGDIFYHYYVKLYTKSGQAKVKDIKGKILNFNVKAYRSYTETGDSGIFTIIVFSNPNSSISNEESWALPSNRIYSPSSYLMNETYGRDTQSKTATYNYPIEFTVPQNIALDDDDYVYIDMMYGPFQTNTSGSGKVYITGTLYQGTITTPPVIPHGFTNFAQYIGEINSVVEDNLISDNAKTTVTYGKLIICDGYMYVISWGSCSSTSYVYEIKPENINLSDYMSSASLVKGVQGYSETVSVSTVNRYYTSDTSYISISINNNRITLNYNSKTGSRLLIAIYSIT